MIPNGEMMDERQQLLELKAKLFESQLREALLTGGIPKLLEDAVDTFRKQQRDLEALVAAIDFLELVVTEDDNRATEQYNLEQERFTEISKQAVEGNLGETRIAMLFHEVMREQLEDSKQAGQVIFGITANAQGIGQEQFARLLQLKAKIYQTATVDYGTRATRHAEAIESTPEGICLLIMLDLRRIGVASMPLLERLDMAWIKKTIKSPTRRNVIKEHLELAQRQIQDADKVYKYAMNESEQTRVERALKLHRRFDEIARKVTVF